MKKALICVLAFLAVAALFSFHGCVTDSAPVYTRDGKEFGVVRGAFRHRWWNYYERALSYAEGEYFAEAEADLREALKQRNEDQRMARTYGMHFIDYFPHRELGVIYYETGRVQEARQALERSLVQDPSAKARFYLDKTRKLQLETEKTRVQPPGITIDAPRQVLTGRDPFTLSGTVEDPSFVSLVRVAGREIFLEGAVRDVSFAETLELEEGSHQVTVEAENLLGGRARIDITVSVDRTAPLILLESIDDSAISGVAYDAGGIEELYVQGAAVSFSRGVKKAPFSAELARPYSEVEIRAIDRAGNTATVLVPVPPADMIAQRPMMLAAGHEFYAGKGIAGALASSRSRPPLIELRGLTGSQTVYLERLYLEGSVQDDGRIASITIDGEEILPAPAQRVFFNRFTSLKEGENLISIRAVDEQGNEAAKHVRVIRKIPEALRLSERLSLSVLPFSEKETLSAGPHLFQEHLTGALLNENRFNLVERERLEHILREQKLSATDLVDRRTAVKVGSLAAAGSILMGDVIATRTGVEVVARCVDTETSEILATGDVYGERKDAQGLKALAGGLALRLHKEFPLVGGIVLQCKGASFFSDMGLDKAKPGRRVLVYREHPITHPVTGKVLGSDCVVMARARVTQVMADMCKMEVVDGDVSAVRPMDKVIME